MSTRPVIVLSSVLRVIAPLVRLLVRSGVTYPAFAAALKHAFLQAAEHELAAQGMSRTASAITLLSGVHRRDVRTLSRLPRAGTGTALSKSVGTAAEVIARWRHLRGNRAGATPKLSRLEFDALVEGTSRDVRPRAVLDELKRLGAALEDDEGIALAASSFAPRQGFEEMAQLFADNLSDHGSAAALNLQDAANFLDQAVFVDGITEASARQLQLAAVAAWKQARKSVMNEAQARFESDSRGVPLPERRHRARFGVYFFSQSEDES